MFVQMKDMQQQLSNLLEFIVLPYVVKSLSVKTHYFLPWDMHSSVYIIH